MIKSFCDKCGTEINKEELIGQFIYIEKTFSLSNDSNVTSPAINKISVLLCEKCCNKIKKAVK